MKVKTRRHGNIIQLTVEHDDGRIEFLYDEIITTGSTPPELRGQASRGHAMYPERTRGCVQSCSERVVWRFRTVLRRGIRSIMEKICM